MASTKTARADNKSLISLSIKTSFSQVVNDWLNWQISRVDKKSALMANPAIKCAGTILVDTGCADSELLVKCLPSI